MCHALLQTPRFFEHLKRIDHELAKQARAEGCLYCGGELHVADYPRKPRGCPAEIREDYGKRLSFCCNRCRKRRTSLSVRFLGRRVYLGLLVVLVSARHAGQIPAPPTTQDTRADQENAPTARCAACGTDCSRSSNACRSPLEFLPGSLSACADNRQHGVLLHSTNIPRRALASPIRDRSVSDVQKTWGFAVGRGTL